VDANAFNRDGTPHDALVDRFEELCVDELTVVTPGGVRDEVADSRTPMEVQNAILPQIFNLRPGLNSEQQAVRRKVEVILQGNAILGKHSADASHLCEAAETGCGYFVTRDKRVLGKRATLQAVLPPSLFIVDVVEFLDIYDRHRAGALA
jgi:predicted nucleic acid-binding protein